MIVHFCIFFFFFFFFFFLGVVILLHDQPDLISCICRSLSPWVRIFDRDQAGLELAAMRKTRTKGAPQLLQIEMNIPMDRILQRNLIEKADDLLEALTFFRTLYRSTKSH
jgi:hypothetical protein